MFSYVLSSFRTVCVSIRFSDASCATAIFSSKMVKWAWILQTASSYERKVSSFHYHHSVLSQVLRPLCVDYCVMLIHLKWYIVKMLCHTFISFHQLLTISQNMMDLSEKTERKFGFKLCVNNCGRIEQFVSKKSTGHNVQQLMWLLCCLFLYPFIYL